LGEVSLGFFLFTIGLLILGATKNYTLTGLLIVCGILFIISIPGLIETWHNIRKNSIPFDNHNLNGTLTEAINPHLLSAEF
jgi:hypothetical protein